MAAGLGSCKPVTPHVRIVFNGVAHRLQVHPGPEGAREFERQVRQLLNLPESYAFEVTFHLKAPGTGDRLQLQGLSSYDAAVHCASLSAASKASSARRSSANAATPVAPQQPPGVARAASEPSSSHGGGGSRSGRSSRSRSSARNGAARGASAARAGGLSRSSTSSSTTSASMGSDHSRRSSGNFGAGSDPLARTPSRGSGSLLLRLLGGTQATQADAGGGQEGAGVQRQASGVRALVSAWFRKGRQSHSA